MDTIKQKKQTPFRVSKVKIGSGTSVFFGILLPIAALLLNNYISTVMPGFNMLYSVGALLMLPRVTYLYIIIGSGIITLFLWLIYFRRKGKRFNGIIGGILLFNALFYLIFGLLAIVRFLVIPVWLPPFCAVPVLIACGIKSLKIAQTVIKKSQVIFSAILGVVLILFLTFSIEKQPWEFLKHLPDARGADFSEMDLRNIYIEGSAGVNFEGADFSNADLSNACFISCNLNMQNTNMEGANLENASLSVVNFKNANFRGANLNNATIYMVDFTSCNFQDASLGFYAQGRIIMNNVNLCGADLSKLEHAHGVYEWNGAEFDSSTKWFVDFKPDTLGFSDGYTIRDNKNIRKE